MTRAEETKAIEERHGLSEKRARKLAQRKPLKTNRLEQEAKPEHLRTKRDSAAVIAHEAAANAPEARAERAELRERRVRASK